MIRALPRVALQLWIVLFIVVFGAEVIHLEPTLRVLTQVLFGAPLAGWALVRLRGPVDRLDWAVLGALVLYAVVCVTSRDRTESLGSLGLVTAYAAWFLLLRRAGELRGAIVLAGATGLALTLAFNAYLLIQEKATWYARVGGAPFEGLMTFPWESVNALPVLVLLALPFLTWLEPSGVRSGLRLVAATSAVIVVPLSLGRAGWLGLACAAMVFVLLAPQTGQAVARLGRPAQVLAGALTSLMIFIAVAGIGPRLIASLGETGRVLLWAQGLAMVAKSPLVGSGPGTYSWARLDVGPAAANLLAVRLSHNLPLQTVIDGGILLSIGLLVVGSVWALTVWRRRLVWSIGDRVALACMVGLAAALTLDDFSYLPAITALSLAVAAFQVPAPHVQPRPFFWVVPAALFLAWFVALPGVVSVDVARWSAQAGRTAMVAGNSVEAAAAFEAAAGAHPENGGYWLGLGMAESYRGNSAGAIDAYQRAIMVTPGDPRGYAALAHLDASNAVGWLRAAADRTTGDPQYAVRLGRALFADGETEAAIHAWGRAVALQPDLIGSLPLVEKSRGSLDAVVDSARLTVRTYPRPAREADLSVLWDIALSVDELPADAGNAWLAVEAAKNGELARAKDLANESIAAAPYQARGYQAQAAVAAFACDRTVTQHALRLEALAQGAYQPLKPEPQLRREFVYREASLGPAQPAGVEPRPDPGRWPWGLIPMPAECEV